jgi:hypothetical protein
MSLSARAIGSALGVSHTAVNKAAASGRISRELDGGFDLERVRREWGENTSSTKQSNGTAAKRKQAPSPKPEPAVRRPRTKVPAHRPRVEPPDPPDPPAAVAETKSPDFLNKSEIERLQGLEVLEKQRRENARAARDLLPRDEVARTFGAIGKIYGAGRDTIPAQLATKLVGKTDLDEIERIIRTELVETDKRIINEIQSRFSDLAGNDNDSGSDS